MASVTHAIHVSEARKFTLYFMLNTYKCAFFGVILNINYCIILTFLTTWAPVRPLCGMGESLYKHQYLLLLLCLHLPNDPLSIPKGYRQHYINWQL